MTLGPSVLSSLRLHHEARGAKVLLIQEDREALACLAEQSLTCPIDEVTVILVQGGLADLGDLGDALG